MSFAALLLVFSMLASGQEPDVRPFNRLELVWNNAHLHGDAAALERLWADDLEVAVPRLPVLKRADAVAFARSGRMHFDRYETSGLNVRVYGDAAVVTGRLQRRRTVNEKTVEDDWRFTKVYVRQNSQWLVVSFHASEAAQP